MELNNSVIVASIKKLGVTRFDLAAGKSLKIETFPQGEEILNVEVPVGKQCNIELSVLITETDI